MIHNEQEYQDAVQRLVDEDTRLKGQHLKLQELDLSNEEVKRILDPIRSFNEQSKDEIGSYERLMRGEFEELSNFVGLGRLLIALRISQCWTQQELAEQLGVHESQVSREERNEYHGITVDRAREILDVLGVEIRSTVEIRPKVASQHNRATA